MPAPITSNVNHEDLGQFIGENHLDKRGNKIPWNGQYINQSGKSVIVRNGNIGTSVIVKDNVNRGEFVGTSIRDEQGNKIHWNGQYVSKGGSTPVRNGIIQEGHDKKVSIHILREIEEKLAILEKLASRPDILSDKVIYQKQLALRRACEEKENPKPDHEKPHYKAIAGLNTPGEPFLP